MSAAGILYSLLTASSAVTSLVGGASDPRIWPHHARPDAVRPLIVYATVDATREEHVGDATGQTQVDARMQVTVVADRPDDLITVKAALKTALHRYHGSVAGHQVHLVFWDLEGPETFDLLNTQTYEQHHDFLIRYTE